MGKRIALIFAAAVAIGTGKHQLAERIAYQALRRGRERVQQFTDPLRALWPGSKESVHV